MGNDICIFCDLLHKKQDLLYEDEYIAIFKDIKPKAKHHLLAITKQHIININYLTKSDIYVLNHMKTKVKEYFKENFPFDSDKLMMGFHVPPVYSIKHLHLHCIIPPFKSKINKFINFNVFYRSIDDTIKKIEDNSQS